MIGSGLASIREPHAEAVVEGHPLLQLLELYIDDTDFKRLINQIAVLQARSNFKSLAILSELPGEGKSFFTAALALAYARHLPSRVLIVDTTSSSRKPSCFFQPILGMHIPRCLRSRGLVEPGVIDLISSFQASEDAGPHSDLQFGEYISSFSHRYDLILVDTAALSAPSHAEIDPVIVAQHTDSSILLTSHHSLERETLMRLKHKLQRYGIEPLGTVFNVGPGR